jgi:hypothetical protein
LGFLYSVLHAVSLLAFGAGMFPPWKNIATAPHCGFDCFLEGCELYAGLQAPVRWLPCPTAGWRATLWASVRWLRRCGLHRVHCSGKNFEDILPRSVIQDGRAPLPMSGAVVARLARISLLMVETALVAGWLSACNIRLDCILVSHYLSLVPEKRLEKGGWAARERRAIMLHGEDWWLCIPGHTCLLIL